MERELFTSELESLLVQIKKDRKDLLDLFEVAIGDSPRWGSIRSKIMSIFGRDGLEGTVKEIISISGTVKNETPRI